MAVTATIFAKLTHALFLVEIKENFLRRISRKSDKRFSSWHWVTQKDGRADRCTDVVSKCSEFYAGLQTTHPSRCVPLLRSGVRPWSRWWSDDKHDDDDNAFVISYHSCIRGAFHSRMQSHVQLIETGSASLALTSQIKCGNGFSSGRSISISGNLSDQNNRYVSFMEMGRKSW